MCRPGAGPEDGGAYGRVLASLSSARDPGSAVDSAVATGLAGELPGLLTWPCSRRGGRAEGGCSPRVPGAWPCRPRKGDSPSAVRRGVLPGLVLARVFSTGARSPSWCPRRRGRCARGHDGCRPSAAAAAAGGGLGATAAAPGLAPPPLHAHARPAAWAPGLRVVPRFLGQLLPLGSLAPEPPSRFLVARRQRSAPSAGPGARGRRWSSACLALAPRGM